MTRSFMYYGRNYEALKSEQGLHYAMLEHYIQKLLDKAADYHEKQLKKLRSDLKKQFETDTKALNNKFSQLTVRFNELKRNYDKVQPKDKGHSEQEEIRQSLIKKGIIRDEINEASGGAATQDCE